MSSGIPIIDLQPFTAGSDEGRRTVTRAVDAACRDVGFLVVVGHGIPQDLLDRAHASARQFFDLDAPTKQRYAPPPRGHLGYRGVEGEMLASSLDQVAP